MEIANEISSHTPNLCHLAPAGPTYIEDLNEAGGVYAVMNELNKKGLLKTDLMTVTGKTVGENIEACVNRNPEVIRPIENPYSETGGIAVLKGKNALQAEYAIVVADQPEGTPGHGFVEKLQALFSAGIACRLNTDFACLHAIQPEPDGSDQHAKKHQFIPIHRVSIRKAEILHGK